MNKFTKKIAIILIGLSVGVCTLFSGCALPAPNPSPTQNGCTVRFISDGREFHSSAVEKGKKVFAPTQPPVKQGYLFNGWDYDFNLAVTENLEINAKWLYYSNVELDVQNREKFIADFVLSDGTDGEISVQADEENSALVARAETPKKGDVLTVEFKEEFPIGTRLIFKASYIHNEDGFSGGASVFVNGEYFEAMPTLGEYAEYVIETTDERDIKTLSFRANTDSVSYTFSVSEMCVLTNMENVDFNEFSSFEKAIVYNIPHTRSVEFDEEEQKNVLVLQMKAYTNKEHILLKYPLGTRLYAGTKIVVRFWFKSLTGIGGGCVNINGYARSMWTEQEKWTDYELLIDTEMNLESISLRPYNPSARYIFKISSIKIVYPSASN